MQSRYRLQKRKRAPSVSPRPGARISHLQLPTAYAVGYFLSPSG